MINKSRKLLIVLISILTISLVGCNKQNKKDEYQIIQESISTGVDSFKSATLETKLTSNETLLYSKTMNVIKAKAGSSYTMLVKELSDSLFSDSLHKETTSNGTLTSEETKSLFPSKEQFKKDKINNFTTNNNVTTFTVLKENLVEIFAIKNQDINKISNEGIKVTLISENNKLKEYNYEYKTNDNINVLIKGVFVY